MDHPIVRGLGEAANDLVTVSLFCLSWETHHLHESVQWSNVCLGATLSPAVGM